MVAATNTPGRSALRFLQPQNDLQVGRHDILVAPEYGMSLRGHTRGYLETIIHLELRND